MLTSAEGSGCPLPASVTTPVMSAFAEPTGSAAATLDPKVRRAAAISDARATVARFRVNETCMLCLDLRCQVSADLLIGERDPLWPERAASSLAGLRLDWRRSGEAGRSVGQPLRRESATADDFMGPGMNAGESRCFCRRRDSSGDELAERAVVFLVYARTPGCSMRLSVRLYSSGRDTSRSGCIHDAGNARQKRLGECADDYPTANSSRKSSSYWCHVIWLANTHWSSM